MASAPAAAMIEVTPAAPAALPTACAAGSGCSLPTDFGERLCRGSYPEVALHLFAPTTPWKRAYLRKSFQAWHVGGRGEMRELRTSEEVLVVNEKAGAGAGLGMGGAFEVLRWDGSCVSLMEDEISFHKPSAAIPANIEWKKLDESMKTALGAEREISELRNAWTKTCDGPAAEREPGRSKCELALRRFSLAIAQSIGRGKVLPPPASLP
ncbi:MAG: hypothetical protein JNK04_13175 [Myxococcales bacterium]|nr:hypothetical protein [Myxococcales bacterium]